MNALLAMPEELRMVLLLLLGAVVGGQVNRAVDLFGTTRRGMNPWDTPPKGAPPRHWYDRLPVFGWLTISREEKQHGRWYWLRPLALELFCMFGLVGLYLWETEGGLLPNLPLLIAPPAIVHSALLMHLVLLPFLLAATFIDLDELIIPDEITVPGTIVGLAMAALLPLGGLPVIVQQAGLQVEPLRVITPKSPLLGNFFQNFPAPAVWPNWLEGIGGLAVGLACWWGWYVVVVPKIVWFRRGWRRGLRYMVVSIRRYAPSRRMTYAAVAITPGIVGVWWYGGENWKSLLSALVGMAVGGGMIWAIRLVGQATLKKEAMGFGDVTLMAMMGAFLGWQAMLATFFMAPFAGLMLAIPMKVINGQRHIPYGPFLSLGGVVTIVAWAYIWEYLRQPLGMGWLVPALLAGGLVLMAIMLSIWHLVLSRFESQTPGE